MAESPPSQLPSLHEELWLMHGQLSLTLWLDVLRLVFDIDCSKEPSDEDSLTLEGNLNHLQQFACQHYSEDLSPLAMISVWHKKRIADQVCCR